MGATSRRTTCSGPGAGKDVLVESGAPFSAAAVCVATRRLYDESHDQPERERTLIGTS